jgi:transcriptional regulator GlxA family with amidase domain
MSNTQLPFHPEILNTAPDVDRSMTRMRKVGFLVFPDFEVLDLCGPLDAFYYADRVLQLTGRANEPGYETLVIASKPGLVKAKCGLQLLASHGCDDITEELDTLIVAGGEGFDQACAEPKLAKWIKDIAPRSRRVASICTGAFLLAEAGLLKNRQVTTHWLYCDRLAAAHPSLRIDPNRIFVRDGNIYTSGGITSGIDLALALVEEDLGREVPRLVAGTLVVFLRRPGGQTQFSPFLQAESKSRHDVRDLQSWILANPAEVLTVSSLADRLAMSPRNFARLFLAESGTTPAKFVELARTEAARCKLEQTSLPVETIAKLCGFGETDRMRRSFQRHLNVTPQDYRARFQSALG